MSDFVNNWLLSPTSLRVGAIEDTGGKAALASATFHLVEAPPFNV